jgi:hypothetical protein
MSKDEINQEEQRLIRRRAWLRSLEQEDRDFISKYGFEMWQKKTGRKVDE